MLITGDPALMHEVLDLLKEAHIKVTFPKPPLVFMRSIQTSWRIHFCSGCSLGFCFSFEIDLILQVTFFVISSLVEQEGGREVCDLVGKHASIVL
jgi:hypothetical protein